MEICIDFSFVRFYFTFQIFLLYTDTVRLNHEEIESHPDRVSDI